MTSKEALAKIKKILGISSEKFFEGKTEQGVSIKLEGELEVGSLVYVATEEGMIPAPPGVHKLDDGTEIEVDESGKITKIKVGDMEEESETEDETEVVEEEMSVEMQFGDIKLKDGSVLRLEGEEPSVGLQIRKVGYDGQLSAVHDGLYETSDGKMLSIVGGQIEGVQSVEDNKKRGEGFAEYAWDECMDDQMKQYGDEEIAKKVCGAIKAGNMSDQFAVAKDKSGLLLSAPSFELGEMVQVISEHGDVVRAKDQGYDIEINGEPKTIFVTDGKISKIEDQRKAEGPEDISEMMEIASMFSQALKKVEEKIDALASKQDKLEQKFMKFSNEPAGSRVYTQKTINEESKPINPKYEGFKKLREVLIQQNN